MIREFFGWMQWVWRNWETWQKLWIVAVFFMGMGWGAEGIARPILLAVPALIFGFYLTKWCLWDSFQESWAKYTQHRNELLTTIKDSDERKRKV